MNASEFEKNLRGKQVLLKRYVNQVFPNRAGRIALRFINGNFRAQGWQGITFDRWKPNKRKGTILVKTGRGRRGTQFSTFPGVVRVFNTVGYMAVHNKGFNGTVIIPAHIRRIMGSKRVETGKLTKTGKMRMKTVATVKMIASVSKHTRKMNIPKRKFMPDNMMDSPVLVNALKREITNELSKIFQ
jgi:hypothetical protein